MNRLASVRAALAAALLALPAAAAADDFAPIEGHLALCASCHGADGAAPLPGTPIIGGQHFYYLYVQLKDFKSGLREHAVMSPIARQFEKADLRLLAQYFSQKPWPRIAFRSDPARAPQGEAGITAGQCVACHLGDFSGNSRNPRLAGQLPDYLHRTMMDFKSKARNNSPAKSSLMESFAEEDIGAMADYLGGL